MFVRLAARGLRDPILITFLISYANPIRNELEFVHSNLGCIKFYWAQPIHSEEAKFLRTSEIAQLEEAFERASINIVGLPRIM
jgi:hypothetical protein